MSTQIKRWFKVFYPIGTKFCDRKTGEIFKVISTGRVIKRGIYEYAVVLEAQ